MPENFEILSRGDGQDAAMMLVHNGTRIDFSQYRKFETLPQEAWEDIDRTVVRTAKENLVGIADLNANPSTSMFYDGMTASVYTRKRISEIGAAVNHVTPDTQSDSAILQMSDLSVPMIVTYKDFSINTKHQTMASNYGMPLGFSLVEEATRSVARKLEDNLFNGEETANGATLYGYTKFPDRQTHTLGTSWETAAPYLILEDVNTMMSFSMQQNHFGPWMLYIPWEYQVRLNQDYLVETSGNPAVGSIRQRLMQLPGLIDIKVSNYVANDNVILVEMTSDTVTLINGMPMRALAWEPPGVPNWDHKFKVMAISVPLLISDYLGNCGIVHGST
ncbi:MAG: encapsulin [Candidatus Peribacteraceae bacterium]|nr:encapsulin [Candidatus Peribacteraceae bacterium]